MRRIVTIILISTLLFAIVSACRRTDGQAERSEEGILVQEEKLNAMRFFLEAVNTDAESEGFGMVRDRYPGSPNASSIASTGFALAILPIAVEEAVMDREAAEARAVGTLETVLGMENLEGFLFHFVDMETARGLPNVEYSTIDTALLAAGAIVAGEYFEGRVKELSNQFFSQINWDYFVDPARQQFYMSKMPGQDGFDGYWDYYAEQLIMYVLGAGSPTYPIDPVVYYRFRRVPDRYGSSEDFYHSWHGSIFTYQYSHAFLDFRGVEDSLGTRWFDNSVQASIAAYDYAGDMGEDFETFREGAWGMSASDSPTGYSGTNGARPSGAENTMNTVDGTIATSGALGSIVFTEEQSLAAMALYNSIPEIQGEFGITNAYNRDRNWYARDAIGIDKGISVLMIENWQSGLVWELFMRNEFVQSGMEKLGFETYETNEATD